MLLDSLVFEHSVCRQAVFLQNCWHGHQHGIGSKLASTFGRLMVVRNLDWSSHSQLRLPARQPCDRTYWLISAQIIMQKVHW